MSNNPPEILIEELIAKDGKLGVFTLNRPHVLNALNHSMFLTLDQQLTAWEKDETIKAVVIKATEGRAFCAGGDIRYAYEQKQKNDTSREFFFRDEYRMNSRIYHFPKPYIALLNGITMGGGAGVSIHGSFRIATPRLLFSMPETGIGFYPDVGATYFLSHLKHKMGFYLGLTSARISYADCLAIGLVNEIVAEESVANIIPLLLKLDSLDSHSIANSLKSLAIASQPSELLEHQQVIENCFSKKTVEDILSALENTSNEWCHHVAKMIKIKSPTSLKVTLAALQKAEHLDFDACIKMETMLTYHFLEGHDFFEGIRAAIIDKDQKPQWKPDQLSEVTAEQVERYFAKASL